MRERAELLVESIISEVNFSYQTEVAALMPGPEAEAMEEIMTRWSEYNSHAEPLQDQIDNHEPIELDKIEAICDHSIARTILSQNNIKLPELQAALVTVH